MIGREARVDGKVVVVGVDGLIGRQGVQVGEFGIGENDRVGRRLFPQIDEMTSFTESFNIEEKIIYNMIFFKEF